MGPRQRIGLSLQDETRKCNGDRRASESQRVPATFPFRNTDGGANDALPVRGQDFTALRSRCLGAFLTHIRRCGFLPPTLQKVKR